MARLTSWKVATIAGGVPDQKKQEKNRPDDAER
jgi:hypothetical protein